VAAQRRTADRQQATDRTKATGPQQATDRRTVAGQRQATGPRRAAGRRAEAGRPTGFLLIIAATGLALIGLYALHLVTTTALVTLPTTMFLYVYLSCTAAATRVLTGAARLAAWPALLVVATVLAFCGFSLAAAATVAAIAAFATRPTRPAAPTLAPTLRTTGTTRTALRMSRAS